MGIRVAQERRKAPRVEWAGRIEVDLPSSRSGLEVQSMNFSEGGMCMRLQAALELHSRFTLRLFEEAQKRPLQCNGRVMWVVQRLDLRDEPPFLYDVGVEFLNPPARLRQLAARAGVILRSSLKAPAVRTILQHAQLHGRTYTPCLTRESAPSPCWHLVVLADEVPCFSQRYPSEREALGAWAHFKLRMGKSAREARR